MTPQPPATVITPPAAPVTPPTPPAAAPPAEDVGALKARLTELEGKVADTERTAQFWYDKAKGGDKPAAKPAAAAVEEPEVDLLEVITTRGVKGLVEVLKKTGIVTKDEAQSLVNNKASQITSEQQLVKDYPDLSDNKSEFFQATAQHYGDLVAKGVPEHMAMQLAAERADLQLLRDGKRKTPQQVKDEDKAQREADRKARREAQGGERGGRAPAEEAEDDELTAEQKHIVASMGITEDAYKKRAKEGVKMRGGMR